MGKIKEMLPYLTAIAVSYFVLLSLLLLIGEMETGGIILLAVIPLICLAFSITYGINHSINLLYAVFVAVLFVPAMLIIDIIVPMWGFAIGYGIVALIGNVIGMRFFKRNVKLKNIEKYGQYFILVVVGSYLVAVMASAIMMAQMKQITYNSTAFGVTIKELKIDFSSNTAMRNYYDFYGEHREHKENPVSNAKKIQIKTVCTLSLFPLWQKYYNNPWVMDGDYYNIVRGYENGESVFYGSNAYPLTYVFVYNVIHNTIA